MLKKMDAAPISSAEFFARSQARLNFDVPPGLVDPNIIPRTGDAGNDRMLEIVAREQPVRPAAVLIPVVDHPRADRAADAALAASHPATPARFPFPAARSTRPMLRRSMPPCARRRRKSASSATSSSRSAISISTAPRSGFASCRRWRGCKPGFKLTINEGEVDDAFEVPLAFLMNPENHQIHTKEFRGMERSYYAMPFAERYIWGATAGILRVLYERIYLA